MTRHRTASAVPIRAYCPITGFPAAADVLSLLLHIYQQDFELDKMLFNQAVPAQCGLRKPRALR